MKIVGNTVGTTMPKPNLTQTDPGKGDYVKGKEEFIQQYAPDSPHNAPLTFTGAVNATYDGSAAVEVKIPQGGGAQGMELPTPEEIGAVSEEAFSVAQTDIINLKSDVNELNDHAGSEDNPHNVTASQVGARPDTWMPSASDVGARPGDWMPTAQEVGARPDTWMPTAAQVGARPADWMPSAADVGARPNTWVPSASDVGARDSTWLPTIAEIGAAPAGYGIGKLENYEVNTDNDIDSVLTSQINGMDGQMFKRIVLSLKAATNFTGGGGHYYADIYKLSTNYAIITIKSYIQLGRTMQRTWFEGALTPWEWGNPPMALGVEYRTTERINGKAVYKKNVDGIIQYRLEGETEWKNQNILVGAAPSGYGLGGTATWIPNADALKGYNANGWYYWSSSNTDPDKPFGAGSMLSIRRSLSYWTQLAFEDGSYTGGVRVRKIIEGNAQPWEWVNPPMTPGVEYRTTKRHNGKPVYTKLVEFGALPNNAEKSVSAMPANASLIQASGYGAGAAYNVPIPGYYAIKSFGSTRSSGALWISTSADMSSFNAWITIEYTKD